MEMDIQWAFTFLPKPTEHKLLRSLFTNQNYSFIQWLISDDCSTTLYFLLPSIPDITQNPKSPTAAWVKHNVIR